MNWAAPNLADGKELRGGGQNERLLQAEESGNQKLHSTKKGNWLQQGHFPLGDGAFHQADDLTIAD